MTTFQAFQRRLTEAKNKIIVLQHLIEHIDEEFRPSPITGNPNKPRAQKVLVTDDKVPVPAEAFETVVNDLMSLLTASEVEVNRILSLNVDATQPREGTDSNGEDEKTRPEASLPNDEQGNKGRGKGRKMARRTGGGTQES